MPRTRLFVTLICPLLFACAPITNLVFPEPTVVPTATPTPTPAPDPCSADAMRKLVDEIQSLAQLYVEAGQKNESWLPLLPDLMALRRNVLQFLNLPRCADKFKDTLSNYTNLDSTELQKLIDSISGGSIEDTVDAVRYWLEEKVDLQSQGN